MYFNNKKIQFILVITVVGSETFTNFMILGPFSNWSTQNHPFMKLCFPKKQQKKQGQWDKNKTYSRTDLHNHLTFCHS